MSNKVLKTDYLSNKTSEKLGAGNDIFEFLRSGMTQFILMESQLIENLYIIMKEETIKKLFKILLES